MDFQINYALNCGTTICKLSIDIDMITAIIILVAFRAKILNKILHLASDTNSLP